MPGAWLCSAPGPLLTTWPSCCFPAALCVACRERRGGQGRAPGAAAAEPQACPLLGWIARRQMAHKPRPVLSELPWLLGGSSAGPAFVTRPVRVCPAFPICLEPLWSPRAALLLPVGVLSGNQPKHAVRRLPAYQPQGSGSVL